jgi:hypothetical protein
LICFCDTFSDIQEKELEEFEPEEYFDTPTEFLMRTYNRPKISELEKGK